MMKYDLKMITITCGIEDSNADLEMMTDEIIIVY